MVTKRRIHPRKGAGKGRGRPRAGRGLFDTIKHSGIISGLASHVPVIGGVASALLGSLGLGKRGRGKPVALHTAPNASSYGGIRT